MEVMDPLVDGAELRAALYRQPLGIVPIEARLQRKRCG